MILHKNVNRRHSHIVISSTVLSNRGITSKKLLPRISMLLSFSLSKTVRFKVSGEDVFGIAKSIVFDAFESISIRFSFFPCIHLTVIGLMRLLFILAAT